MSRKPAYIYGDLLEGHEDFACAFLHLSNVKHYQKGTVLLRQDEAAPGLYLLLDGMMECSYISASGRKKIISIHTGRWVFGSSSLDGYQHTMNHVCLSQAKAAFMPVDKLKFWDNSMLLTLAKCQTYKMHFYNRQLREQTYQSIEDRILQVLTEWATAHGDCSENGSPLALGMKQQIIGDLVGVSRVQVSKMINRLALEDKIRIADRGVEICNRSEEESTNA